MDARADVIVAVFHMYNITWAACSAWAVIHFWYDDAVVATTTNLPLPGYISSPRLHRPFSGPTVDTAFPVRPSHRYLRGERSEQKKKKEDERSAQNEEDAKI